MRKSIIFIFILALTGILVACNTDQKDEETNDEEELVMLDVEFDVPEKADPNEAVTLTATVTYGDKPVKDATEVLFEIWEVGHEDDSEKIEPTNNDDGTYSLDYTFKKDGIYEMYAHTTAEGMHVMPKKQITIGEATKNNAEDHEAHGEGEHFATEGFDMHFMEPENVTTDSEIDLTTHITIDEAPLEGAKVRYEIFPEGKEDDVEWADAKEVKKGEYTGSHSFAEPGSYSVQIHVKDDTDLHEHTMKQIEVK